MDQTKIDVITGVLTKQMERSREQGTLARREMSEHRGAAQVLALMAQQIPSFVAEMEKRVAEDSDLGSASEKVRIYVKGVCSRFHAMCESQANHQRNQTMISEGRAQAAEQTVVALEKEISLERAATARRDELETERRVAEASAQQSDDAEVVDGDPDEVNPEPKLPKAGRKPRADKGMPRKRRAG